MQMKALEILTDNYISVASDIDTEMALYYQDHIQIAISELEALENRSCESCKYSKDVFSYTYPLCIKDENNPFQIHNIEKLKCNRWESK